MLWLIRRGCGLGEDVDKLKFELGVKNSAAETELVQKSEVILIYPKSTSTTDDRRQKKKDSLSLRSVYCETRRVHGDKS